MKKQSIYFQYTITQSIYYHSKRGELGHSEEMLDQIKSKTQQGKLQRCSSISDVKERTCLFPSGFAPAIYFPLLGWFNSVQLSLVGISQLWHLQYPGGAILGSKLTAPHNGLFKSNHNTRCLASAAF